MHRLLKAPLRASTPSGHTVNPSLGALSLHGMAARPSPLRRLLAEKFPAQAVILLELTAQR